MRRISTSNMGRHLEARFGHCRLYFLQQSLETNCTWWDHALLFARQSCLLPTYSHYLICWQSTPSPAICLSVVHRTTFDRARSRCGVLFDPTRGSTFQKDWLLTLSFYKIIPPWVLLCSAIPAINHKSHLKQKLNKMKLNVDVIYINGLLHKTDKFWRIQLFCNKTHMREADFCLLVTTNACRVLISCPLPCK